MLVLLSTDNNKLLMQWKGRFIVEQIVSMNDYKVREKDKLPMGSVVKDKIWQGI